MSRSTLDRDTGPAADPRIDPGAPTDARPFDNVLFCPLARRDNASAFRRARHLSAAGSGPLTVLGVVPEPPRLQRLLHRPESQLTVRAHLIETADATLTRQYQGTDEAPVERIVEEGNPAAAIIERVLCRQHDLVIVTVDDDAAHTTTVRRLLRQCPVPVWVMRPTRAKTARVLAAVDPNPDEDGLNDLILHHARSLAALDGGELHVVHAWELYGESSLRSSAFIHEPDRAVDELVDDTESAHRQALDALVARHPSPTVPWQVHLVKGAPTSTIPALVSQERINLLVMGTVARGGLSGMLMGNTAEHVLDQVRCSVMAVKPPSPPAADLSGGD